MDESSLRELMERLHSLECATRDMRIQVRRWRLCGLASILIVFGFLALGAQGPNQRDSIRVRRIELVDAHGDLGALLESTEDGPAIALSDKKGKPRMTMSVHRSGRVALDFCDETGTSRMRLGRFPDRSAALLMLGETGTGAETKRLVELGVTGNDTGFVSLHDKGGENRVLLNATAGPDGASSFTLRERAGTREIKLDCNPNGAAAANVVERDTGRRVGLGVPRGGREGPALDIFGRDGRLVGAFMVLPNGDAALQLRDREQRVQFQVPQSARKD